MPTQESEAASARVLVYAHHERTLREVEGLLAAQGSIRVVKGITDAADIPRAAATHRPDVVVAEVGGSAQAMETCRDMRARFPEIACIVLAAYADSDDAFASAMLVGAQAYITRLGDDVATAVEAVAGGDRPLLSEISDRLAHLDRQEAQAVFTDLADQERELLTHIAEGLTNAEIADVMHLAPRTVRNYVSRLLAKLQVRNRSQLAAALAYIAGRQASRRR